MDQLGIEGRVVVVTGTAQGIGAAVARTLGRSGGRIAAVDVDGDRLNDVVRGIEPEALPYVADVRDPAQVDLVVKRVERDLGAVDILVNVAGVLRTAPATELTDEDWAYVFSVNATGVFNFSRAVARAMLPRRSGSIITVSSNASHVPRTGMAAYAASKAASTMFTRCLGLELAPHGIRCNIVAPGSTDTPMQRSLWTSGNGAESVIAGDSEAYRAGIPLGKLASPFDVADAVAFLASDRARHITMQELCVDGGASL
ncbi:2,3-dihydro-2,3-dihydroxybenzoate dehydrogenase [Phytoactinopolyspora limicola]|uniref:2,3-dihydro-2,3-dihydroxybenzoate dehydrogenase n=1 Tax=Phytoactinopolyspora limicola TaxID=2715536 RepID=UPI001407F2A0|nr:2,3-dihydro-2,3-dihydroxybenzoate dehydrogenase [Phytoactinopolyspora limicola]